MRVDSKFIDKIPVWVYNGKSCTTKISPQQCTLTAKHVTGFKSYVVELKQT